MSVTAPCPSRSQATGWRGALLVSFGALLLGPALHAQSDTIWQRTLPWKPAYTLLDPKGHLLVVTDSGVLALDPDSGVTVWQFSTAGRLAALRLLSDSTILIGAQQQMALLDLATGDTLWRRTGLPDLTRAGIAAKWGDSTGVVRTPEGIVVIDLSSGGVLWDSTALPSVQVRGLLKLWAPDLFLVLARTRATESALMGVERRTGAVVWTDSSLFAARVPYRKDDGVEYVSVRAPITLPDTTIVMYFTSEGPIRLDPRSGEVIWRSEALRGLDVPSAREEMPATQLLDSLLIVPAGDRVVALDVATGRQLWATQIPFPDKVELLAARNAGIVVGNVNGRVPYLAILGPDGARRRPGDWLIDDYARARIVDETVFVAARKHLYALPLATGRESDLASLGFEGRDVPWRIDTIPGGGLVVMGWQNLVGFSRTGTVLYRRYYPAPKGTFLGILMGDPRYNAWAAKSPDYFYIFTGKPDSAGRQGPSLVVLDKASGRELDRMWFKDRDPGFRINYKSGTVFRVDGMAITARRFHHLLPIPRAVPDSALIPLGRARTTNPARDRGVQGSE